MKRISFILAATLLLAAVSCNKEVNPAVDNDQPVVEDNQPISTVQKMSFTAYADNGDGTRTSLNEDNSVTWAAGEAIYVFDGKAPRKFVSTNTEPAKVVTFEGEAAEATTYYAVSPAATMSGNAITATIPVFQTATAGTFDPKAAISVAVSGTDPNDPTALKFKNAAAAVKFKIRNDDVTKIRLDAISGEKLAGKATIVWDDVKSIPNLQMVQDEAESCVILTGAFVANTDYVIAVAPGTYEGGFRLTLIKADGKYASFANTNSQTLERSDIMNFGAMPVVPSDKWKNGTPTTFFTETFNGIEGTGGHDNYWTGQIGSEDIVFDNANLWESTNKCGGADHCLKMGGSGGNDLGSLYTKSLDVTGSATLTFSAAGWGTGTNYLEVEVEGAEASGDCDIDLDNAQWNDYTVNISNAQGSIVITFYMKRGFIDDIKLVTTQGGGPVDPVVTPTSVSITNVNPQNNTVGPTDAVASFDVVANAPWTIEADDSFVDLSVSDNHVTVHFEDMTEGTSRDVTITVVPIEGESESVTLTQTVTKTLYKVSYTAIANDFSGKGSGEFYTKNSDASMSNKWTFSRSSFVFTQNSSGYVQLGSKNDVEELTFSTSTISGAIQKIMIDCAAYNGNHKIQIKVGESVVKTENAPSWTGSSGGTVSWTGEASGTITITATPQSGGRAFYLKTITVEYEQ